MSEFLDVLQQAWLGVPESLRFWLTAAAVVLAVWTVGALVKHLLTYRRRDALAASSLAKNFKADAIVERDAEGRVHRRNPSPAEAKRQCKKCFHVWRVRHGYITFIGYRVADGLSEQDVEKAAREAMKGMTHKAKAVAGGFLLRSWKS